MINRTKTPYFDGNFAALGDCPRDVRTQIYFRMMEITQNKRKDLPNGRIFGRTPVDIPSEPNDYIINRTGEFIQASSWIESQIGNGKVEVINRFDGSPYAI